MRTATARLAAVAVALAAALAVCRAELRIDIDLVGVAGDVAGGATAARKNSFRFGAAPGAVVSVGPMVRDDLSRAAVQREKLTRVRLSASERDVMEERGSNFWLRFADERDRRFNVLCPTEALARAVGERRPVKGERTDGKLQVNPLDPPPAGDVLRPEVRVMLGRALRPLHRHLDLLAAARGKADYFYLIGPLHRSARVPQGMLLGGGTVCLVEAYEFSAEARYTSLGLHRGRQGEAPTLSDFVTMRSAPPIMSSNLLRAREVHISTLYRDHLLPSAKKMLARDEERVRQLAPDDQSDSAENARESLDASQKNLRQAVLGRRLLDDFERLAAGEKLPARLVPLPVWVFDQDPGVFAHQVTPRGGASDVVIGTVKLKNLGKPWQDVVARHMGREVPFVQPSTVSSSLNRGGNIEVTPPLLPDYPYGRAVMGVPFEGSKREFPERTYETFRAGLQPPVRVPTSWLGVGHVDEVISIVPSGDTKHGFQILVNDAVKGLEALEELVDLVEKAGGDPKELRLDGWEHHTFMASSVLSYKDTRCPAGEVSAWELARGKGREIVRGGPMGEYPQYMAPFATLNREAVWTELRRAQKAIHETCVDKVIETLKKELGIGDEYFVRVPALWDIAMSRRWKEGDKDDKGGRVLLMKAEFPAGMAGLEVGTLLPNAVNHLVLPDGAGGVTHVVPRQHSFRLPDDATHRKVIPKDSPTRDWFEYKFLQALGVLEADGRPARAGGARLRRHIYFVEDLQLHTSHGDVHCATNAVREPLPAGQRAWWRQQPPKGSPWRELDGEQRVKELRESMKPLETPAALKEEAARALEEVERYERLVKEQALDAGVEGSTFRALIDKAPKGVLGTIY